MQIKKIGEFGLIKRFRRSIKTDASVIKGSGDDCAVLALDKKNYQLFTCDMIVEGVDFRKTDKPELIGRKALAVSISDIAACGGIPCHAVVSLGLPKNISLEKVDKISQGLFKLAREFKVNIVGGDLSRAAKITIDVSMLGIVEKKYLALRSRAKIGDVIFVTGELGGSILGRHLKFNPRVKEARFLVKNFKINSMIDISDGLAQDLGHILEESGVGGVIYEDLIPKSAQARSLADALYSGEDFELSFTMPAQEAEKLLEQKLNIFQPIGKIVGKKFGLRLVNKDSKVKILAVKGFRHF